MSARVVNHGHHLTIDVSGLAAEVVESIKRSQQVMAGMTAAEWFEWSALPDYEAKDAYLMARVEDDREATVPNETVATVRTTEAWIQVTS